MHQKDHDNVEIIYVVGCLSEIRQKSQQKKVETIIDKIHYTQIIYVIVGCLSKIRQKS